MISTAALLQRVQHAFSSDGVVKNTSWLLSAEMISKVSRLFTIIALSSQLSTATFGVAMLALACHEIIRTIMRCGAGAQLVQCDEQALKTFAQTAKALQWGLAGFLFILQFSVAIALGSFYASDELTHLVQVMGFTYLLFPIVSINVFLIQREGQFKYLSIRNALCIITENLVTGALVFTPLGIWALVVGKFVFALLWVGFFYRAPVKQYALKINFKVLLYLTSTSAHLFISELLKATKHHADLFIASKLFSPEEAGLYAFARSAGVGLSQSLSTAFSSALYPHLCKKFRANSCAPVSPKLWFAGAAIAFIFVLQGIAAQLYVPLFFADKWAASIPIVATLCFSAAPFLMFEVHNTLLRAKGKFSLETKSRLLLLVVTVIVFLMLNPQTAQDLALCVLYGNVTTLLFTFIYHLSSGLGLGSNTRCVGHQ